MASTLSLWREQFLAAGQLALKGKSGQADIRDEQINRLKKKVGELTMDNELLQEKVQRLEAGLPCFPPRIGLFSPPGPEK